MGEIESSRGFSVISYMSFERIIKVLRGKISVFFVSKYQPKSNLQNNKKEI